MTDQQPHVAAAPVAFAAFVTGATWTWAKTYAETSPHWYVRRNDDDRAGFEAAVVFIRFAWLQGEVGGRTFTHYDDDGYQFWRMGAPAAGTVLINRALLPLVEPTSA